MIPEHILKDFVMDVDGFYYFCPSRSGSFASHHLREIADALDEKNAPAQKELEEFFKNE